MLYQKLDVWKRSRLLAISVYRQTSACGDFGFRGQITRSALSIPSNIAEGCERQSLKERCRFLDIAKGSLGEFRTQTDIGMEIGYIPRELGSKWLEESDELAKMLSSLIQRLNTD